MNRIPTCASSKAAHHPTNKLFAILMTLLLLTLAASQRTSAAEAQSATAVAAAIDTYRRAHEWDILVDFVELLSLPNDSINLEDMDRNVDLIREILEPRGFSIKVLQAGGAPYVYAELNQPGATETLLLYAHFDGQPVQEANWTYPPFSPTLVDAPLQEGKPVDLTKLNGTYRLGIMLKGAVLEKHLPSSQTVNDKKSILN